VHSARRADLEHALGAPRHADRRLLHGHAVAPTHDPGDRRGIGKHEVLGARHSDGARDTSRHGQQVAAHHAGVAHHHLVAVVEPVAGCFLHRRRDQQQRHVGRHAEPVAAVAVRVALRELRIDGRSVADRERTDPRCRNLKAARVGDTALEDRDDLHVDHHLLRGIDGTLPTQLQHAVVRVGGIDAPLPSRGGEIPGGQRQRTPPVGIGRGLCVVIEPLACRLVVPIDVETQRRGPRCVRVQAPQADVQDRSGPVLLRIRGHRGAVRGAIQSLLLSARRRRLRLVPRRRRAHRWLRGLLRDPGDDGRRQDPCQDDRCGPTTMRQGHGSHSTGVTAVTAGRRCCPRQAARTPRVRIAALGGLEARTGR
jgi:hypothetical protein